MNKNKKIQKLENEIERLETSVILDIKDKIKAIFYGLRKNRMQRNRIILILLGFFSVPTVVILAALKIVPSFVELIIFFLSFGVMFSEIIALADPARTEKYDEIVGKKTEELFKERQNKIDKLKLELDKLEFNIVNQDIIKDKLEDSGKVIHNEFVSNIMIDVLDILNKAYLTKEESEYYKNKFIEIISYYLIAIQNLNENKKINSNRVILLLDSKELIDKELINEITMLKLKIMELSNYNRNISNTNSDINTVEEIINKAKVLTR